MEHEKVGCRSRNAVDSRALGELMPHRSPAFTQVDIARAIRAMRAEGYEDVRVRITREGAVVEPVPAVGKSEPAPRQGEQEPERVFVC